MSGRQQHQYDARLFSVSPMSDVDSDRPRSLTASPVREVAELLPPRGGGGSSSSSNLDVAAPSAGDERTSCRLLNFQDTTTALAFGVVLGSDSVGNKDRRKSGVDDYFYYSCSGNSTACAISWGTAAMLAKHVYLYDIVCSRAGSAALYNPPASQSSSAAEHAERLLSSSSSSSPAVTAWEHLLCSLLFRTAVVLGHRAVSWDEQHRMEETLAAVRQWTRMLVDGFLRWVPPSTGLRLLLSSSGGCDGVEVALLGMEDVWLVQQHWASLRRYWSTTESAAAAPVLRREAPREDLLRTVRVFQRHCVRALRWLKDGDGDAYRASDDSRIIHVMAAVAHIEAYLETAAPCCDDSGVECHNCDHNNSKSGSSASSLPFTAIQRDYLVDLLAPLLLRHNSVCAEGKFAASHWILEHLKTEAHAAIFSGPSRLLFHDFLASLAHWLVLQVVPMLLHCVNVAGRRWPYAQSRRNEYDDASLSPSSAPRRSLRLRFECVDVSDKEHVGLKGAATRRNVFSSITISEWLRWVRNEQRQRSQQLDNSNGSDNKSGRCCAVRGDSTYWLHFFPSLSSTGAALLLLLDSLRLFGQVPHPAAPGVLLSERLFEHSGALTVSRLAIGCSYTEVSMLRRRYCCAPVAVSHPVVSRGALQLFTLAEFLTRYRTIVDAARVSYYAPRVRQHEAKQVEAVVDSWRPLPPLFRISLDNFDAFSPTNQVRLICSAAAVDYVTYASGKEEDEQEAAWVRHAERRGDLGVFSGNGAATAAPMESRVRGGVAVMEDSGLVKMYDCAALEQLEAARWRSSAQLHECGTVILQAFLRARWSGRWNYTPLRRRAHRRAIVVLQTALRVCRAMLVVGRQQQRQQQRWREARRQQDAARECLLRRLELQAGTDDARAAKAAGSTTTTGQERGDHTEKDGMHVVSLSPTTVKSRPAAPTEGDDGDAGYTAAVSFPPRSSADKCVIAVDGIRTEACHGKICGESSVMNTLFALEAKGRDLVQLAEAKRRRNLLMIVEEQMRERCRLQEYRERRAVMHRREDEKQQAVLKGSRRQRRKQQHQQQRRHSMAKTPNNAAQRAHPPSATTHSVVPPATEPADGEGNTSDVVIVIDVNDEDEVAPPRSRRATSKRLAAPGRGLAQSPGVRVLARAPHSAGAAAMPKTTAAGVNAAAPRDPVQRAVWRQEHEDRTFIELSERYRRHMLQQSRALAAVVLTEMLRRRFIFLAGVLEQQELLARWRNIIVPYCLVTEAVQGDFLATVVLLQEAPRRRVPGAVRAVLGLRSQRANSAPRRTASATCVQRRRGEMADGNDENVYGGKNNKNGSSSYRNEKRFAASLQIAERQRDFLCKPSFDLLARRSAHSRLFSGDATVTLRAEQQQQRSSAVTTTATGKAERKPRKVENAVTARKRIVTWVDPSPPAV